MNKEKILTTEGRRFSRDKIAATQAKVNTTFSTKGSFEIPPNIINLDNAFIGYYSDQELLKQSVARVITEDISSFYKTSADFTPPFNIKNAKFEKVSIGVGYIRYWCIAIELYDESEKKKWLMSYYRSPSPGVRGTTTQKSNPVFTEILTKTFKISDVPLELIQKNPSEALKAIQKAAERKTSDILKKTTREKLGGMFD